MIKDVNGKIFNEMPLYRKMDRYYIFQEYFMTNL